MWSNHYGNLVHWVVVYGVWSGIRIPPIVCWLVRCMEDVVYWISMAHHWIMVVILWMHQVTTTALIFIMNIGPWNVPSTFKNTKVWSTEPIGWSVRIRLRMATLRQRRGMSLVLDYLHRFLILLFLYMFTKFGIHRSHPSLLEWNTKVARFTIEKYTFGIRFFSVRFDFHYLFIGAPSANRHFREWYFHYLYQ